MFDSSLPIAPSEPFQRGYIFFEKVANDKENLFLTFSAMFFFNILYNNIACYSRANSVMIEHGHLVVQIYLMID